MGGGAIAQIGQEDIALFVLFLIGVLALLVGYFFLSYWKSERKRGESPYTGMPLRFASELTYLAKDKVRAYLKSYGEFDNRPFDFSSAALCRDTGRLFPECVTWTGAIKLDWSFIQKRCKGNFVSWGSLTPERRKEILAAHDPLFGFQTDFSSPNPSPRMVDEKFALAKPGPLYVDPESMVILGWKAVPETELEVLIVQKPKKIHVVKSNS